VAGGASSPARPSSALANSQFRLLFIGNVVTMLGFGMMQVVQGVLAFDLTGKNSSVGFVAMGMGIPMLLLGPIGGALSDRMSKRMLLMFGQTAVGSVFFLVGIITVLGAISIWILAGLTLLLGCAFAMLMPARQAWVGDLLQGPALANGIALQQLAMNATRIVGPLAAGGMIALSVIGIGGTYMVMSSLFLIAMGLLLRMQPTQSRRDGRSTSVFGDLGIGLRYTWRTPDVRLPMLMFAGVVLTAFSYQLLMPGFLENELGQPANRVGVMYGATAIGGIVLTLFLTSRGVGVNPARLMFICGAALAGTVVLLAISPTFPIALGAAALVGAASSGFQMCNQVNLMQRTDAAYFGRVMSLTMTAFGLQMIVGFPAGALADQAGERATLILFAVCCLAIVAAGYLWSRSILAPASQPDRQGEAW
jgi:predicted MFS family arabinose efflux permease